MGAKRLPNRATAIILRSSTALIVLVVLAIPAFAAKRVTVAQLEQTLTAAHAKSDADIAQQLSDLELTERASAATLDRLKADAPGAKSYQRLVILADRSAFLELPANEIPAKPTPDGPTQRQIMALVVNYVTKTMHQLPNFLASRATRSFEDRPEGILSYAPLHLARETRTSVIYQGGQEKVDAAADKNRASEVEGLVSWGEFGPILSTILLDAAQSKLIWSHWEQNPVVSATAVFRYEVPAKKSHYLIRFCCVSDDGLYNGLPNSTTYVFHELAAYHGQITVDPANGAILRVTVEADIPPGEPLTAASIMVEYGDVQIGGTNYICPVRSVALAQRRVHVETLEARPAAAMDKSPIKTRLNDVAFEQYHVFRSEARVLSGNEANSDNGQPVAASSNAGTTKEEEEEEESNTHDPTATAAAPTQQAGSDSVPALPPRPASPQIDSTPKQELIDRVPTFKTTTRAVVVDVVVTKSNGEPILGLGKQDFAVMEDGKPQAIDFFEQHTARNHSESAPLVMPVMAPGTITNVPPIPESDAVNILLLDTLNTEPQDQSFVHREITEFLTKMQPGTRVAIFMLGSKLRFVQSFTNDTSLLLAALNNKRTGTTAEKNSTFQSRSDQADDAAHIAALRMEQASPFAIEALQAAQADAGAHDYASRASMTFEALNYLGHYLSGIAGRKNLIWFASSFPVIIFPTVEQRERLKQNSDLPGFLDKVRTTADLFTLSKIAVYPIGAEGVITEHVAEANAPGPGASGGMGHMGATGSTMSPYNAGVGERASTVYAMEQLAASTGGKAYFNTNDLNGAMQRAIDDGANYYTIGYSPIDKKMDGSYRQINVKLANGKYKLAYRNGYNADDLPALAAKAGTNPLGPLLIFGMPAATGVLYGAHVVAATPQPAAATERAGQNSALQGPLTRYNVGLIIRAQDVVLQPNPQGGRSGKILIGVKAYDHQGNAVNWAGDEETLTMGNADYDAIQKTGISAHLEIDLPSGTDLSLQTAVYDWGTGRAGTLNIPLTSPGAADTSAQEPRKAKSDGTQIP